MPLVIRLGDTSDHGGAMVTSASKTYYNDRLACRIGDILDCPIHGPNPVAEGSAKQVVEGSPLARQGDHTECGAALISLQANSEDADA
jgi:uncharacterized Zn-binding protein involved in type VI secretion